MKRFQNYISIIQILLVFFFSGHKADNVERKKWWRNLFQKIPMKDKQQRQVSRQAYAGLLWSKQFYYYVIEEWLQGDSNQPRPPASRLKGRNFEWMHLFNMDIISMPDKWEYPWVKFEF